MTETKGWIVVKIAQDGQEIPQGLDQASGGYPYDVRDVRSINFFASPQEAQQYCSTINGSTFENKEDVVIITPRTKNNPDVYGWFEVRRATLSLIIHED